MQMTHTKIVLIGAGSVVFTMRMFQDLIFHQQTLDGATIVLVDIDERKLEKIAALALQLISRTDLNFQIQHTSDRALALQEAQYVIIAVEIDRDRLWKLDWEIPLKHGVKHVLGENAGPGGLSHTLRIIPLVLEICRDIERICPDAWVLNLTNPEGRVCLAISSHTGLKAVGLCHQIGEGHYIVAHLLGLVDFAGPWPDNLHKQEKAKRLLAIQAAGINHFTWILDVREKATGRDLYPALREAARTATPEFEPLSRYLLDLTGLMPAAGDQHAGELIKYAWEFVGLSGFDFDLMDQRRQDFNRLLEKREHRESDLSQWVSGHSIERVVDFIAAIHGNQDSYELSANIINQGCISNLPSDAIVEVPVLVNGAGIHGLHVGELPTVVAAMCAQQIAVQELSVEAAVSGDRRTALQALLIDPLVPDPRIAEAMLDEFIDVHAANLPQFARR